MSSAALRARRFISTAVRTTGECAIELGWVVVEEGNT